MPLVKPSSKVSRDRNWKPLYIRYKELHQAVKCKKSGERTARRFWSLKEAEGQRETRFLRFWAACNKSKRDPKCVRLSGQSS